MRRFWDRLSDLLTRRPARVAIAAAIVTLALAPGIARLEFATGQDSYLNADSQIAIDNEEYQRLFGGQAMLTVFSATEEGGDVRSLFEGENLEALDELERELRAVTGDDGEPLFPSVVTPLTGLQFTHNLAVGEGNPLTAPGGVALTNARERELEAGNQVEADARLRDSAYTAIRLLGTPPGGGEPFASLPPELAAQVSAGDALVPNGELLAPENVDVVATILSLSSSQVAEIEDSPNAALLPAVRALLGGGGDTGPLEVSVREGLVVGDGRTFTDALRDNPGWAEFLLTDNANLIDDDPKRFWSPAEGEPQEIRKALRPVFPTPAGVAPTLENARHAQLVVRLDGNLSIEEEAAAAEAMIDVVDRFDDRFEGFRLTTTGAPVLLDEVNDYLQGGMLTLGGMAVGIMAVILLIGFRVRQRLLPLAVVLVGVSWSFSLFGWIGIPLSLVTISGLPILIGMGIDFAIQTHARVNEEVRLGTPSPFRETVRSLGGPIMAAAVAAVVALAATQASLVPMIRDFGWIIAIGILLISAIGLCLPTSALAAAEHRRPTPLGLRQGRLDRLVVRLGGLPKRAAVPLILAGVVLVVGSVLLEDNLRIETDPERWVDQASPNLADLEDVRAATGSASELGVFVRSDELFTDETAEVVHDLAARTFEEEGDRLLTASGVVSTASYLLEVPGATPLPPTGEDVRATYEGAPPDVQASFVRLSEEGADGGAFNIVFRVGEGSLEVRDEIVRTMEEETIPAVAEGTATSATPSGLAVVGVGLLRNLEANRALLTYLALGLVLVWLLIRFRSLGRALLALVPSLVAVGTSTVVIAALGITTSPLTTVSGPLVVANCTEFASLILSRYLEERRRGLDVRTACDRASSRTGTAFMLSAFTTVAGFAVLMGSALPLLRDFGAVVALNVGVALLSALVVLPPLLAWADDKGLLKILDVGIDVDLELRDDRPEQPSPAAGTRAD